MLVYCSPLPIQADADNIRATLRRSHISLDIRDREYFVSRSSSTQGQRAAAEELSRLLVDPLLTSRQVLETASLSLSTEEQRLATTYLQLELHHRDPARNLTKLAVEAIVIYCLREASPETLVPRSDVRKHVARHIRGADVTRLDVLTDAALKRLVEKETAKHHQKADAFTLSFKFRETMKGKVQQLLASESALHTTAQSHLTHVAKDLGVSYKFPSKEVALDSLRVIDHIFFEFGRLAAVALVGRGTFSAPRHSIDSVCRKLIAHQGAVFESLASINKEQFLDLVPATVERMLARLDPPVAERLRTLSDAYCLQFLLQQTPDVQGAINKIVAGTTLLVDTSVVINAMAERTRPREQQKMTNLLRAAKIMGCSLVAGDDVINELETHIERIRYNYRIGQAEGVGFSAPLLQQAWSSAQTEGTFSGSFEQYLSFFKGEDTPQQDLMEYLQSELGISHRNLRDELAQLPQDQLGDLFNEWKLRKHRRPWVDEQSFETLIMHDARAFLLVEVQRKATRQEATYGHRWWWLVIDGTAVRFDRQRHGTALGSCVCMSPDFFARYLSLATKSSGFAAADSLIPPSAVHLAGLGLVPDDLRQDAQRIYQSLENEPEFLRQRRLRDLVNRAIATANEDGNDDE